MSAIVDMSITDKLHGESAQIHGEVNRRVIARVIARRNSGARIEFEAKPNSAPIDNYPRAFANFISTLFKNYDENNENKLKTHQLVSYSLHTRYTCTVQGWM